MDTGTEQRKSVMILANGGKQVGWGHIMRCCSIGNAIESLGARVVFAVMNRESASLVSSLGFDSLVVQAPSSSSELDAECIAAMASETSAQVVMVDSYDVSGSFFRKLSESPIGVAYIDDLFFEGTGRLEKPQPLDVDLVVNYGFSFEDADYSCAYDGMQTQFLVGPLFAPIRSTFSGLQHDVRSQVERILLTSGSTNPNRAIERMLAACTDLDDGIEINVVVGKNASVDIPRSDRSRVIVHEGVSDLSELMVCSDIVVASAGSTLYELACLGVPTIALPVVTNQLCNAKGFYDRGLGLASLELDWSSADLETMLTSLVGDWDARKTFSTCMRETVDGRGASRIALSLLEDIVVPE